MGAYLHVDLTKGKILAKELPESWPRQYLGGVGFCARILWDEVGPETNPLGPENLIVLATGPVTGTFFPPSGRYVFATKSPLTGIWSESHCGGYFGPELKYSGYDLVILEGKSEKPVYLFLDDGSAELKGAEDLWGKDTRDTIKSIRQDLSDQSIEVACIGPAGENLVKYASVISDFYRAAGRSGVGCVMGSKKLKAVAVRGTRDLEVADPEKYFEVATEAYEMCAKGVWGEAAENSLGTYGTPNLLPLMNTIGRQPTKNHWAGVCEFVEEIGPEAVRQKYRVGRDSCLSCVIQCKFLSYVPSGSYAGTLTGGPEYETVTSLGSNCLNKDLESVIHANLLCNLYGMDTISVGKCISFAMECYEKGIIDRADMDGVDLKWSNADAMIQMIHKIARREGFGGLLAEGVRVASEKIGKGSERFAIHGKGLEVSAQDGRAHKSIGLTHAISVRGADHLRSLCTIDELCYVDIARKRFGEKNIKDVCDLLSEKGKGLIVKDQEDFFAIVDSLLICKYGTMWPPIYYFDFLTNLIPSLTGMKEYADEAELRLTAERICNLRRAFNVREGQNRRDEELHPRFTREPMPTGPAKGQIVQLTPMLDEYYKLRGWDVRSGLPLRSTLERVGLRDVAAELQQKNRLAE